MNPLNLVTDVYERKARLYPALLLVAPLVSAALVIFSEYLSSAQSLGAALLGLGGAFLLAQLARDLGKNREKELFAKWGGIPSVAIFRHSDTRLDAITKVRYHKRLAKLVKEAKAPTVDEEKADPSAADRVYSAWSNYLRVNTRDAKKFALLFHENVNYGYRRNVWGLRAFGIAGCMLGGFICLARLYSVYESTGDLEGPAVGVAAFVFVLLILWVFRFTADWVRIPADAYAARLVECVEMLTADRPSAKR